MVVDTHPGVTVAQIPECHTVHHVLMLAQHTEQAVVLVVLQGLHVGSHWLRLATREAQLSTHLRVHADVQFGDVDMLHQLRILGDGSVDVLF